jgi:hypothetical protein
MLIACVVGTVASCVHGSCQSSKALVLQCLWPLEHDRHSTKAHIGSEKVVKSLQTRDVCLTPH